MYKKSGAQGPYLSGVKKCRDTLKCRVGGAASHSGAYGRRGHHPNYSKLSSESGKGRENREELQMWPWCGTINSTFREEKRYKSLDSNGQFDLGVTKPFRKWR